MAVYDLLSKLSVVNTLVPAVRNAAANGLTVDLANFEGAMFVASVGVITDGAHTLTVQESFDGGTVWSAVAAANLQGAFVVLTPNSVQRVGYVGNAKHVRAVGASSGTTGAAYAVTVVRGAARRQPVA